MYATQVLKTVSISFLHQLLKFLFTNISLKKKTYSNFSLCSYISRNINIPWDQAPLSLQLQVSRLSSSLVYLCPSVLFSPFSLPHTGIQVQHLPMQNNTNRSEHHVLVRSKGDIWLIRTGMHKSWVKGHRGNYILYGDA